MNNAFAIVLGIAICLGLAALLGEDPWVVAKILVMGSVVSLSSLGYTLFYSTPLIFTGLSVAVAFHAGLFNIGAEGQLYMGALVLTAVSLGFGGLPPFVAPIAGIILAFLGGALWGGLAGWFKTARGSHEVIVTIMLNFISYAICGFAIMNLFKNPFSQNPESAVIPSSYFLPGLGKISEVSPLNLAFVLALVTSGLVYVLLFKTSWGFEVRLLGSKPETARRAGIPVSRRLIEAMAVSGGLAGLVAVNEIMGATHKFRDQFSSGYGFVGIAVALLGRNRPLGIIFAALLFGALAKGSLDFELDTEKITRDMAVVMQGLIILLVASEGLWRSAWRRLQRKRT